MPHFVAPLLIAPGAHLIVYPVGRAAQRQFTQREQVAFAEEIFDGALGAVADVHFALFQPLTQIVRRQIHQHHFIGAVEKGIGYGFAHLNAGDAAYHVIQALQMLHVDGGNHVDTGIQQLFNVLPALGMARALYVGVRQFIHQDHRRMARQRGVEVEFRMARPTSGAPRQHRQSLQQRGGLFTAVGFDHASQHVQPLRTQALRLLQHGVGFPYARTGAEVDFQFTAMAVAVIEQQGIGIGAR